MIPLGFHHVYFALIIAFNEPRIPKQKTIENIFVLFHFTSNPKFCNFFLQIPRTAQDICIAGQMFNKVHLNAVTKKPETMVVLCGFQFIERISHSCVPYSTDRKLKRKGIVINITCERMQFK